MKNNQLKFKTTVKDLGGSYIIVLPKSVSSKLPSRGINMVNVKVGNNSFVTLLEPDGVGSHWFILKDKFLKNLDSKMLNFTLELVAKWPEPNIPSDINNKLKVDSVLNTIWSSLTTQARWDFLRWVNETSNKSTRKARIDKMTNMLKSGKRRPCCFNRTRCTNYKFSKSGKLNI